MFLKILFLTLLLIKKKLPFKGSSGMYNAENKNLFNVDDYENIYRAAIGENIGTTVGGK